MKARHTLKKQLHAKAEPMKDSHSARSVSPSSPARNLAKRAGTTLLGALSLLGVEAAGSSFFDAVPEANAQEIQLTGPLAGAPACRNCRMYRQGRFEIAPSVSFTLLDEYQRLILVGGRLNYNLTEWLAIGGWGAFSPAPLKLATDLTERIQEQNAARIAGSNDPDQQADFQTARALTAINMGPNFEDQLGTIDWIASPQITLIPFRGKIGMFQSIYFDTDFYIFGGPAFVGLTERDECITDPNATPIQTCAPQTGQTQAWDMASRSEIAPTFGLGFQFYVASWGALGVEWRGLPVDRNVGGFDNHGGGPNDEFPDLSVDENDLETKFNQLITISFGISLPVDYQVSE